MTLARFIAFALGAAALIALTVYAGAGAVIHTLSELRIEGLVLIAGLHLPIIALMGWAWWQIGHDYPGASRAKFAWARLVRDSAAEVLPFSQLGGFILGVRALHLRGVGALHGALSMSIDLVIELWAKLPYFLVGSVVLFMLAPGTRLAKAVPLAFALTALVVVLPFLFRRQLRRALEVSATAIARRWPKLGTDGETRSFFDRAFAHRGRLFASFGIHQLCWFLGAGETWVMLLLMGARVGLGEALVIDSLVAGLRTFAFLVPAAAGVQEASYVLAGALFGLPPATAIALSLARRARDIFIGLPTLGAWQFLEAQGARPAATGDN